MLIRMKRWSSSIWPLLFLPDKAGQNIFTDCSFCLCGNYAWKLYTGNKHINAIDLFWIKIILKILCFYFWLHFCNVALPTYQSNYCFLSEKKCLISILFKEYKKAFIIIAKIIQYIIMNTSDCILGRIQIFSSICE